ncbi:tRNA lysidine(34) synthetase TilS [bacterium]|nr:tRNA lysidine(34) synthetase TilS [bacterium]
MKKNIVKIDLYREFVKSCLESDLIRRDDCVVVALSGGADSTVLLDLFNRWREDEGFIRLAVSHYNHKLRPEADSEEKHVIELCHRMKIPCIVGSGDVMGEAKRRGESLHVAGRAMRYDFLVSSAERHFPDVKDNCRRIVATGHHRDDNVETILMRLFNGSGIDGLAGIKRQEIWKGRSNPLIIRPLLDFSRVEIEYYAEQRKLQFVTDKSNFDPAYPRNLIRHEIVPVLRAKFGDKVVERIMRSGELLKMSAEFTASAVEEAFAKTIIGSCEDEIVLDYDTFSSYLIMLRLNIIRRAAWKLSGRDTRISFERYRAADRYLSEGKTGTIELGNDILVLRWERKIFIYSSFQEPDWEQRFSPGETVKIPRFGRIEARLQPRERCNIPPPAGSQYCDYEVIGTGPYFVRPVRNGDRIEPYGMTGRRKVSDILREAGIPPHRRQYPVITTGGHIAVVPPFRVAEQFKLTDKTRQVVIFRFIEKC